MRPSWPRALASLAWRLAVAWVVVLGVVAATGFLLTGPAANIWPLTVEDEISLALERSRTPWANTATDLMSRVANTGVIVATCAVVAAGLRVLLRRSREALLVVACTLGQSLVFLSTTLIIDRERPEVVQLDISPPTSSYPSGHTSAALALYSSLAVLVGKQMRRTWPRRLLVTVLLAVPLGVAIARLYRGMHHPSDVAGSLLDALLVVGVTYMVFRSVRLPDDPAPAGPLASSRPLSNQPLSNQPLSSPPLSSPPRSLS